jgi:alpha-ketoglutarate-dependent taurine dioxygenase
MSLSNADNRDKRQLNGGAHWHTDLVHSDTPASFTMLNAVAVPKSGGGTMFANQVAAFEALSPERQALAESITVIHCYEGRRDGSMPTFHHPLVRRHPVTGRNALFGAADTGIGIVGMPVHKPGCWMRRGPCDTAALRLSPLQPDLVIRGQRAAAALRRR